MLARFYKNFRKRENSTKVPDATVEYKDINITLKDNVSLHTPVLLLSDTDIVNGYNYLLLAGSYYYVNDIVRVSNNLYSVECRKDCLASYKAEIGAQEQYLLRSDKVYNPNITDNMYPAECFPSISRQTASMGFVNGGSYVIGIVSGQGVNYYSITSQAFASLCNALFAEKQDTLWDTIVDAASTISKSFLNVFDYIVSCIWFPYAQFPGTSQSMQFGYWDSGINGNLLSKDYVYIPTQSLSFTLYHTTDISRKYLDDMPYTRYELFIPGCGNVAINHAGIGRYDQISVAYNVSIDGSINGSVFVPDSQAISRFSGNIGVQVQISQNGISWPPIVGAIAGIGTMAATIYSGIGGAVAPLLGLAGAVSSIDNVPPTPTSSGANGAFGLSHIYPSMILTCYHYSVIDYSARIGHVSLKTSVPGTGFNLVHDPDIPFGDFYEKSEIARYMRDGFYYE